MAFFLAQDPQEPGTANHSESAATVAESDTPPLLEQGASVNEIASAEEVSATVIERKTAQARATEAQEGTVLITVVDDVTGAVLPGAKIEVSNPAALGFYDLVTATEDHEEIVKLLDNYPSNYLSYVSNGVGQVRIPHPGDFLIVAGRHDAHFGSAQEFDIASKEITLLLHEFQPLQIKVVDSNGLAVAGVAAAIGTGDRFYFTPLVKVQTNADGIAVINNPAERRDLFAKKADSIHIGLNIITANPIEFPLDWNDWPSELITLVCPPLSQLEVLVYNSKGALVVPGFDVYLDFTNQANFDSFDPVFARFLQDSPQKKTTRQGRVLFPFVEIQQSVRITAISPNEELRDSQTLTSPKFAGGKTTVTLTPATQNPILVGRILNDRGKVGRYKSLDVRLEIDNKYFDEVDVTTDGDGKFRVQIKDTGGRSGLLSLRLTLEATQRKPKRVAYAEVPLPLPNGDANLGDFILEAASLIAEGRVVDSVGEPISGARVVLEYRNEYDADGEVPWWPMDWDFTEETTTDGTFAIRGDAEQEPLRLSISHRNHLSKEQEIIAGQSGLEVVLSRASNVVGQVLLDSEIDATMLKVTVTSAEDLDKPTVVTFMNFLDTGPETELAEDGTFKIDGCTPGRAVLVVEAILTGQELYRMDSLMIASGGEEQSLIDIDLRGQLSVIILTAIDGRGAKVPGVQIVENKHIWFSSSIKQPFSLIAKGSIPSLTLRAQGWRDTKIENFSQDLEVVMRKGISISVALENPGVIPKGYEVNAWLFPLTLTDSDRPFATSVHLENIHARGASALLKSSGSLQVVFQLLPTDETRRRFENMWIEFPAAFNGAERQGRAWPVIEVQDVDTEQSFHVAMDEQILKDLMEFIEGLPESD